jgi:hypothetical protein
MRRRSVEDHIKDAERLWSMMKENVSKQIIDRNQIAVAMTMFNKAHNRALNENRRYLLNESIK